MNLGCCVSDPAQLQMLASAGADYCELPLSSLVMAGAQPAFEALAGRLAAAAVPPFACNVFLPPGLAVVGPAVDADALDRYLATALARAARLGVQLLVFGSGRSRTVPDGFSREKARDQLAAFLARAGGECRRRGIVLALEPLHEAETNLIVSVGEGAAFLAEREPQGVTLLADLYHMVEQGEDLAVLDGCGSLLTHTHVADSGRRAPGQGSYPLAEFFERLHRIGYGGRCSIECRWADFGAEIGESLAFLRRTVAAAGWAAA